MTLNIQTIHKLAKRKKVVVGIGNGDRVSFSARIAEGNRLAEVRIFDNSSELVTALKENKVDAVVRGRLAASETIQQLKKQFGLKYMMRAAVMLSPNKKFFLLMPIGIDEGKTMKEKFSLLTLSSNLVKKFEEEPVIGILSSGHREDVVRGSTIRKSLESGDRLAESLCGRGVEAKHFGISIEEAVEYCNILLLPNGVVGNYVFRSLYYLGNWNSLGAPLLNLDRVYVDTSRGKLDYVDSIALASALVNLEQMGSSSVARKLSGNPALQGRNLQAC